MKYTKIEVDLKKCSLPTIIEIWLYSKENNKLSDLLETHFSLELKELISDYMTDEL